MLYDGLDDVRAHTVLDTQREFDSTKHEGSTEDLYG
jgi:hypothetical protein